MITLASIKSQVAAHQPQTLELGDNRHAAVALLLRQGQRDVEMLFIERASREHDPWSGQMALPGGMVEQFDTDARQAAERETAEEVGIGLSASEYLGRLDDQQGRHRGHPQGIVVRGYIYAVNGPTAEKPNYEVDNIVWTPISSFLDPHRYTRVTHPVEPDETFPGVRISSREHQVVWGLTRRFMTSFFSIIGVTFEG